MISCPVDGQRLGFVCVISSRIRALTFGLKRSLSFA